MPRFFVYIVFHTFLFLLGLRRVPGHARVVGHKYLVLHTHDSPWGEIMHERRTKRHKFTIELLVFTFTIAKTRLYFLLPLKVSHEAYQQIRMEESLSD